MAQYGKGGYTSNKSDAIINPHTGRPRSVKDKQGNIKYQSISQDQSSKIADLQAQLAAQKQEKLGFKKAEDYKPESQQPRPFKHESGQERVDRVLATNAGLSHQSRLDAITKQSRANVKEYKKKPKGGGGGKLAKIVAQHRTNMEAAKETPKKVTDYNKDSSDD